MLSTASVLADTSNYDGLYRLSGDESSHWDCTSAGMDGGEFQVLNGELKSIEMFCVLDDPLGMEGMDATLFEAHCRGEGGEWEQWFTLACAEEGILFIADGFVAVWQSSNPTTGAYIAQQTETMESNDVVSAAVDVSAALATRSCPGYDLQCLDLSNARLMGDDFQNADLCGAILQGEGALPI